jgi:CBS domain containing-hemolysin-like protein
MARKLNRVYADHLLFTNQVVTYLLTPREDLSAVEGTQEIEDVVKQLRRDSRARPIEVG